MGFHIAKADENGSRITASERELSPGPTLVEYPTDPLGQILETADGRAIQQQPSKDNRRRAWVWQGYPAWFQKYKDLWALLEPMRSRLRKEGGAATPYVYVKDDVTDELRRLVTVAGTATTATASTLTDSSQGWTTNAFIGYTIEIIQATGAGQIRTIQSNTGTQVTVAPTWTVTPDATSKYTIRGKVSDWFRVRVLQCSKQVAPAKQVTYEEIRFSFVVDDPAFNFLG